MLIAPFLFLDAQLHHGDDWQDHFSISIASIEASVDDVEYPGNRGPRLHSPEEIVLIEERRKTVETQSRQAENERRKAKRQSKA